MAPWIPTARPAPNAWSSSSRSERQRSPLRRRSRSLSRWRSSARWPAAISVAGSGAAPVIDVDPAAGTGVTIAGLTVTSGSVGVRSEQQQPVDQGRRRSPGTGPLGRQEADRCGGPRPRRAWSSDRHDDSGTSAWRGSTSRLLGARLAGVSAAVDAAIRTSTSVRATRQAPRRRISRREADGRARPSSASRCQGARGAMEGGVYWSRDCCELESCPVRTADLTTIVVRQHVGAGG